MIKHVLHQIFGTEVGQCGSVTKYGADGKSTFKSRARGLTSFPSTKMHTQGATISPQFFVATFI